MICLLNPTGLTCLQVKTVQLGKKGHFGPTFQGRTWTLLERFDIFVLTFHLKQFRGHLAIFDLIDLKFPFDDQGLRQ